MMYITHIAFIVFCTDSVYLMLGCLSVSFLQCFTTAFLQFSIKCQLCHRFDSAGSWPPSMSSFSSNFSLNLELHDNTNHGSLSGRSIHEIWSPNPSPKGSYPSTPSEDSMPYFSSHENRESPYHNRSPVDIIVGRRNGSPMLSSPCSLPSDQSFMHYHSRVDNPQYYSSGFTSLDSFNNNHTIGNGLESSHEFENGKGYPRHNMHAIRALQFVEPGIESNRDGTSEASEPASPGCSEDSQQGRGKNRRSFVHFEEKDCSSAKQKNGYILASHECMMPAAKRLGSGLDECLEQLRHLEKECRKVWLLHDYYIHFAPSTNAFL